MTRQLVRGNIINPQTAYRCDYIDDGAMLVENGKITNIGRYREFNRLKCKQVDCRGKFIMPGFIDTHLHIPQIDQRALYGESLLDWLQKYIYPAEEKFRNKAIAEDVSRRFFQEALKNGTTVVSAYSTHHYGSTDVAFNVAAQLGVKAFIGKTMMDYCATNDRKAPETTKTSIAAVLKLIKKWDGYDQGRLRYVLTPRFAPACTAELLQEVGKISRDQQLPVQTHLSENEDEVISVLRRFRSCKTYTEVYDKYGILTPRTVLAHCLHLHDSEFALIEERQSKIAHCPSSNFFLKSGTFRMHQAEKFNIDIGLGSDIGAGPSFSLFDVAKSANYAQPFQVPPEKMYYYATLGGARCLGIDDTAGNLDKGKDADFIIVDIKNIYPRFKFISLANTLAFMIYLGNDRLIDAVYIRGKKIYKSRAKNSIEDFQAWSADPFAWERKVTDKAKNAGMETRKERKHKRRKSQSIAKQKQSKTKHPAQEALISDSKEKVTGMRTVSFPIRPDCSIEMLIPEEGLSLKELHKLGLFLYPYCNDIDPEKTQWPSLLN